MPVIDNSVVSTDVVREIELAGATIQVIARRLADGWFGIWKCRTCGRGGVNGVVYHTPEMAFDMTAENLKLQGCGCTAGKPVRTFNSTTRRA